MSNREKFKETFEQIGMSEDKLLDIENLEIRTNKRFVRNPAIAFALVLVCAFVFLAGKRVFDRDYRIR